MGKIEVCPRAVLESLDFPVIKELLSQSIHSEATLPLVEALRPISDIAEIKDRLRLVTEMRAIREDGGEFPIDSFENVENEIGILGKEGGLLQPEGVRKVGTLLGLSNSVKSYLKDCLEEQPLLFAMSNKLSALPEIEKRIIRTVGPEGEILDSAGQGLRKIRKSIQTAENKMRKRLDEIMGKLVKEGVAREGNPTIRNGRFVIPVIIEKKNRLKGVIHDSSASGTTLFIEPLEVIELSNKVQSLKVEESREIERILKEICGELRPHAREIALNYDTLMEIDLIYAKSEISRIMNACAPILSEGGEVTLKKARNPVLEQLREVVPLDYTQGDGVRTIVITGPNAGGKTVALKTVGLFSLMVQSGLHVPLSEESKMVVYDSIFSDIGDRQSIAEDLSTFTSHMKNLKEILDNADEKSLVLIDEIGTGTDPAEGAAFSAAFLEELNERGAATIVTTHHSALKALAQERDRFLNCSMEFDVDTLTPTYKFLSGVPGSSFALEISRKLGISEALIKDAESRIGSDNVRVDRLLIDLERERQILRKTEEEVTALQSRLNKMVTEYEEKLQNSTSFGKKLKAEAAIEAKSILADANAAIEKAVREIKESAGESKVIKTSKKRIDKQKKDVDDLISSNSEVEEENHKPLRPEEIKPGMKVSIPSLRVSGSIEEVIAGKKDAVVSVGSTKIRIGIDKLFEPDSDTIDESSYVSTGYRGPGVREVSHEVSLRGMRAEEAISVLDKYLDDVLLAGFSRVEVIHGKGEGILKKLVAERLESHPHVKKFHTPEPKMGGAGVTVVELD